MLVDFNYPFAQQSSAVHGLTKLNTKAALNYSSYYSQSNIFKFTQAIPINEIRMMDITIDIKTTTSSVSSSYYIMSPLYNNNATLYTNISAISNATLVKTETINNTTVYTMRARFRWFNTSYTSSSSYAISGMHFYAYYGYSTAYGGRPDYSNTSYAVDCELVSVDSFILTKNLTATALAVTNEYKTGIYPYIKIASRAPINNRLPISVKVIKDGTLTNTNSIYVNNGSNTDVITNYCENAIVQNILDTNINEDFKLYSFTAFRDKITVDYPVPDYYDNKPILKVFCASSQNISFGNPSTSTAYLRYCIPANERYDGKSLKLDLTLTTGSTYYILVATGPKSYFGNTSRNYPGSVYLYYDETAEYLQSVPSSYTINIANAAIIEADKTYSFLDFTNAYSIGNGMQLYYKFVPEVSGIYNIKLSNFFSNSGQNINNSNNRVMIYLYNSSGSSISNFGYYYTEDQIISNSTYLNLVAGTTYYFGIYFYRGSYYCRNVDFKIYLATQGNTVTNAVNIGAIPIDKPWILDTDSTEYGNLHYDYDTPLYFKMYLYKGIKYSFTALTDQGRAITAKILSEDGNSTIATLSTSSTTFTSAYTCTETGWYLLKLNNYSSSYTSGDGHCRISVLGELEGDSGYGRSRNNPIPLGKIAIGTNTYKSQEISGGLYYSYREGQYPLWFEIDCENGDTYKITSTSRDADNYIHIYKSDGSLLGSNDDSGGNLNFSYTFTASYTGKYYFRIGYYGSSKTEATGYCTFTITRTDN